MKFTDLSPEEQSHICRILGGLTADRTSPFYTRMWKWVTGVQDKPVVPPGDIAFFKNSALAADIMYAWTPQCAVESISADFISHLFPGPGWIETYSRRRNIPWEKVSPKLYAALTSPGAPFVTFHFSVEDLTKE